MRGAMNRTSESTKNAQSQLPAVPRTPEPILTGKQVAERLQVSPSMIYELTRKRSRRPLPVLRVGKYLRFRWSEVEAWLDEGRQSRRK